ncbi:hypothetical protein [Parafrankia elaeagni]|uniref:hypothetical protein n=1 Tax=Parafrankia elaeagni TaxID=222534 RepID=UPI00037E8F91|nr:hypothetical protein [Parafrankia elaeagni]
MQGYPNEGLSVVYMSAIDITFSEDVDSVTGGDAGPPPIAAARLLSARRRLEEALAAALAELLPLSRRFTVTVDDPDNAELARALRWVADSPVTPDEASAQLGVTVPEADLPGWVSAWPVRSRDPQGATTFFFAHPGTPAAELAVDLADWLQTTLADAWISDPAPPCPGHPYPMRPAVHNATPWWKCPAGGPVRPWRQARPTTG